jgi:hypothetical protein
MTRRIEGRHLAGTEQHGQRQLVIKYIINSKSQPHAVPLVDTTESVITGCSMPTRRKTERRFRRPRAAKLAISTSSIRTLRSIWTSQKGGKRAYSGRLGKDRSPRHTLHSIASANRLRRPFATFAICSAADRPRPEAELPLPSFAVCSDAKRNFRRSR